MFDDLMEKLKAKAWQSSRPTKGHGAHKHVAYIGADVIYELDVALRTIRDFPIPEQDNMVAVNMRKIAAAGLQRANEIGESAP
jgi:hypothetical protein